MIDTITPIREKRKELSKNIPEILNILKEGTMKANKVADQTLYEVKSAMGIVYDEIFIKEQEEKYN